MKLLFVNACLRGEESRTLRLCRDYIAKFMKRASQKDETWELAEVDLSKEELPVQDADSEARIAELISEGKVDEPCFRFAKQLMEADRILIGAPYWDLQFPAKLKVWLEACCVCGLSFYYSPEGIPRGQCRADKLVYITTSGGAIGSLNFGYDYAKGLFANLLGVQESEFISAEELDIFGNDVEAILKAAEDKITEQVEKI